MLPGVQVNARKIQYGYVLEDAIGRQQCHL